MAIRGGHLQAALFLINVWGYQNDWLGRAIEWAAQYGKLEMMPTLNTELENYRKNNPNHTIRKYYPLHAAAKGGQVETFKYLLEKNENMCEKYEFHTVLDLAIIGGNFQLVSYILKEIAQNSKILTEKEMNIWLRSALNTAAQYGRLNILKLVLEQITFFSKTLFPGCNIGQAFGHAVTYGHLSTAKYLFEIGCEIPSWLEHYGQLPFRVVQALQENHIKIALYLMQQITFKIGSSEFSILANPSPDNLKIISYFKEKSSQEIEPGQAEKLSKASWKNTFFNAIQEQKTTLAENTSENKQPYNLD